MQGIVVRSYSGYHYLRACQDAEGKLRLGSEIECRSRGKLKRDSKEILVGDLVEFAELEAGKGIIEKVLPRKSQLNRPAMANLNQLVITIAVEPAVNLSLLDRMLVAAEIAQLRVVICLNKIDLGDQDPFYEELVSLYRGIGYPVVQTSAKTGKGIADLRSELKGQLSALSGPSGVGKSALLTALCPSWHLASGDLSRGTGRGKHTTRYAQLLILDQWSLVADTPGFTALNLPGLKKAELAAAFPEFAAAGACRFRSCLHKDEPDRAVRRTAAKSRYQSYLAFLKEIEEGERHGKY